MLRLLIRSTINFIVLISDLFVECLHGSELEDPTRLERSSADGIKTILEPLFILYSV